MTRLTQQQSARIATLPAEYRVVGIDRSAPLVRRPAGQLLTIERDGRLVAATIAAQHRLDDRRAAHARRPARKKPGRASREADVTRLSDRPAFATPYTAVLD